MKVSVIIPCYNAAATIARQLEALVQQRMEPWEVIVADNGSTDDSVQVAQVFATRLPRFQIVDASGRRGASYARNEGANAATGEALAFCDADDEVAPDWIGAIHAALAEHDFVASRFDERKLSTHIRRTTFTHPQGKGLIRDPTFDFLPRAGGCGLAIKKHLHESVGGFDESIPFHEDTDYCWKVQLSGTPLWYACEAVVCIRHRETHAERFRQARRWSAAQVLLYKKYRPLGMPKISNKAALEEWASIFVVVARALVGRARLPRLDWRLGTRVGRIQGSIMFLTLLL